LIKYADDSTLVVPEDSDIGLETEFNNILEWADNNSMVINLPKTKELIFYNPRARPKSFPPPIPTVERVTSAKLLGIYIQDNFKCDMHLKYIMTVSSQRLHILKALKRQGLSLEMLHNVFYAIIVSKLVYGISSWYSFLVKSQVIQINSFFKRAYKYGYLKSIITIEELLDSYDDHLFHRASCDNHCLHHLLPAARSTNYALRDVSHGLSIDYVQSELHKRTFINRMIFSNCY